MEQSGATFEFIGDQAYTDREHAPPAKRRVLIISTSSGTGHVAAGAALAKAFAQDDRAGEVVHEDALRFANKFFRDFYSKGYTSMVRSAPTLFGWAYRSSDELWKTDSLRLRIDRLNTGPLVRFIRRFDPHITVCTHFMPAGIISHLIETKALRTRLAVVVTDFDCHAMWLSRTFHRYFVAIEEAKAHLQALGFPGHRITISGIPIDPFFSTRIDRAGSDDVTAFDRFARRRARADRRSVETSPPRCANHRSLRTGRGAQAKNRGAGSRRCRPLLRARLQRADVRAHADGRPFHR